MFESLDIMISLGVVFLILSMILKYAMTVIKRIFKTKAKVIAEEMRVFVGENTSRYLIPYLDKRARHLNFLEKLKSKGALDEIQGLRQLSSEDLKEIVNRLSAFLKNKTAKRIKDELGLSMAEEEIKEKMREIRGHLENLKTKVEQGYDNTLAKISERYESKLRMYTLIAGLVFAVVINADFFEVYRSFSENSLVRERLTAQAEVINGQMELLSRQIDQKAGEGITDVKAYTEEMRKDFAALKSELNRAGLNMGWRWEHYQKVKRFFGLDKKRGAGNEAQGERKQAFHLRDVLSLFKKLVGLMISGILISFGAPFWHDFLASFTGIRRILRDRATRKEPPAKPAAP